ncbi:polysaccharide deacetylase family protein [Pontibacter chitinilyticus]|uniref:polysaccharide deacetylase family protein n=1 Tax=Pontibacter chitinilyticus TaxID=2674989 RepID=UPI00321AF637
MIRLYKTPVLVKKLMHRYTWARAGQARELFLTFDDGPIPDVTPWVLEQLQQHGAKATFFCVGENVAKHTDVARQVLAQGHKLANHTYNHLKGWHTPLQDYLQNVAKCQSELDKLQPQQEHRLFRPPYGRITSRQAAHLASTYELIMWDMLTNDYDQTLGAEKCLQKALKHTQSGSIIVFHDSLKARHNLMYTLPRFLEHFCGLGYTFKTL